MPTRLDGEVAFPVPAHDHATAVPCAARLPGGHPVRSLDPSRPGRADVVAIADAYLRACLDRSVSIGALSRAIRVPTRTLQRRFRQDLGVSPIAYGKALRLNAARRDLLQGYPGQTITEIAMRWGFNHVGYFSGDYRRMFGERPSETARKALAHSHPVEPVPHTSGARHDRR